MSRMNWDRVRTEYRERKHGVEWMESDGHGFCGDSPFSSRLDELLAPRHLRSIHVGGKTSSRLFLPAHRTKGRLPGKRPGHKGQGRA